MKISDRKSFLFFHNWQKEHSARSSSSSVAAYNSSVHWENIIRNSVWEWIWKVKEWSHITDPRMGNFFWLVATAAINCDTYVLSLGLFCFSQCVRNGWGMDSSLFSPWIQGLASYQHELLRTKKTTWSQC